MLQLIAQNCLETEKLFKKLVEKIVEIFFPNLL